MHGIAEKVGEVRTISFIADNTFTIMCAHLSLVTIPCFYVYNQILKGNTKYSDFPIDGFLSSAWTRYKANTNLIGFFCGLLGSLVLAYLINLVLNSIAAKGKRTIQIQLK